MQSRAKFGKVVWYFCLSASTGGAIKCQLSMVTKPSNNLLQVCTACRAFVSAKPCSRFGSDQVNLKWKRLVISYEVQVGLQQ